ncbi:MAG TPA: hypothetical protein VKM55_26430 [Candidatus Lokiarchaeia archaeon]|nr:hypothetical protein [Candidatus Lokiarchaeia archaeon]
MQIGASESNGKNSLVFKYVVMYAGLKHDNVEVIKGTIEDFLQS